LSFNKEEDLMNNSPIVEEVREAGKKISEECDNDINKYAEYIKRGEEESKKKGWETVTKEDFIKV